MATSEIIGLAGVPIIVALVEIAKLWIADKRLYPLIAIAFGLLLNVGATLIADATLGQAAIYGIIAGLAASGLYSGSKASLLPPGLNDPS